MTFTWNGDKLAFRIRGGSSTAVVLGTEMIRDEAVRLIMSPPKTGRIYKKRGRVHQASAPGQPPAHDLGELVGSIETRYDIKDAYMEGFVEVSSRKAKWLEYGTPKILPRPFMRPAVSNMKQAVRDTVVQELKALFI